MKRNIENASLLRINEYSPVFLTGINLTTSVLFIPSFGISPPGWLTRMAWSLWIPWTREFKVTSRPVKKTKSKLNDRYYS